MTQAGKELTIFKSIRDNRTHRNMSFESWTKMRNVLYSLSKQPGKKPSKGEKTTSECSPLISPAIYTPDTTRANANVIAWAGWAALDVDDLKGESLETALKAFSGISCICYSSASSSIENPKLRVVVELDRYVLPTEIRHFWYALQEKFNSLGDKQCKDFSRMYYVPAKYPTSSNNFFLDLAGSAIDVDALLAEIPFTEKLEPRRFVDSFPPEIIEKLKSFNRAGMAEKNFLWTSYRDCPFVNQKLVNQYFSCSDTGWYHGLYRIMVSIAATAIRRGYAITANQIADLVRQIDLESGGWYKNRPLELEASRALEFVCASSL